MKSILIVSVGIIFLTSIFLIPQASALPVSFNQSSINLNLASSVRNSSSYDVFTTGPPGNFLWMKFDNNTSDSSTSTNTISTTYNTNLVDFWRLDSTLTDNKNVTNTLVKAAGTTTYASGIENNGTVFDGSTYYKPTGAFGAYNFDKNTAFSFSFWLNWSTAGLGGFIVKDSNIAATNIGYTIENDAGRIAFVINTDSPATYFAETAGTYNNGAWHHIVCTFDGSSNQNGIKIYVDGSLISTGAALAMTGTAKNTQPFVLGADSSGGNLYNGKMDEVRMYNTALTSSQVKALYMVGHYSQSHEFDGGEFLTSSNTPSSTGNSDRSMTVWAFPTSFSASSSIMSYGTAGTNTEALFYLDTGGHAAFFDGSHTYTSTGTVSLNTYTQISYVISSSGTSLKIYFNGVLDSTQAITALNTSSGNFHIGSDIPGTLPFIGQLDNLKTYSIALTQAQITSDFGSISPISIPQSSTLVSWYHGISGSSTLTKKLGFGQNTITLSCNLNTVTPAIISNGSNIYYMCNSVVKKLDINSGTSIYYFTSQNTTNTNNRYLFQTTKDIMALMSSSTSAGGILSTKSINNTGLPGVTSFQVTNEKINAGALTQGLKYNSNTTSLQTVSTNACELSFLPTNKNQTIDSIACDQSIPASTIRYWNGFGIQKIASYSTNSTQQFLSSIDASPYKKLLSLPCKILINESPCVDFILTDTSNTDYLIVISANHIFFKNAQTALSTLTTHNYALQSYDVITTTTTSAYEVQNPLLQAMTLYGFSLNTTINQAGLFTLPSGYTVRSTTISPSIRTIDPQWTDDTTDIPIITSTSSLFPIFLTASNAPAFSAIKVTNGAQLVNGQEAVWAVAQLDSTRSVEFDLPPGVCANIYIADISISPSVWDFEGIICATGVNQKTIAFTNTVPFTFFTQKYGVTSNYVPSNNGLITTFHSNASPVTYRVVIQNSTGAVAINSTFSLLANQTLDTRSFNVSSVTKPASLTVSVSGNPIYTSYLGSPLSLASVSSFFHQYLSYQGFDFLSFIPIIFASMFTRNTVGIGVALTVVLIATLSWLSVVVIPEMDIYIMIVVAAIAMIGYRSLYG